PPQHHPRTVGPPRPRPAGHPHQRGGGLLRTPWCDPGRRGTHRDPTGGGADPVGSGRQPVPRDRPPRPRHRPPDRPFQARPAARTRVGAVGPPQTRRRPGRRPGRAHTPPPLDLSPPWRQETPPPPPPR